LFKANATVAGVFKTAPRPPGSRYFLSLVNTVGLPTKQPESLAGTYGNNRKGRRVHPASPHGRPFREFHMLGWALTFLILALVAGFFGFFSLAGLAASIAKILFMIFLVLLIVSFVMRALRGRSVV
jgi:uncharacterized membrane protein YtjA (UPF0391 family)